MPEKERRRYLVLLQLGDAAPARLKTLVPSLTTALQKISGGNFEQVFRSVTADAFGYFVQTHLNAGQLYAALESPTKGDWIYEDRIDVAPFLSNTDALFVMEVGDDYRAGQRFSRPQTWLQHHK